MFVRKLSIIKLILVILGFFLVTFHQQFKYLLYLTNELSNTDYNSLYTDINDHRLRKYSKFGISHSLFTRQAKFVLPSLNYLYFGDDEAHSGSIFPLFPDEVSNGNDRIWNQMMYAPRIDKKSQPKLIVTFNGAPPDLNIDRVFSGCPVKHCVLTDDLGMSGEADMLLWTNDYRQLPTELSKTWRRDPQQIWMVYLLESPFHTPSLSSAQMVNWTATYRHDSTIVTPYFKYTPFDLLHNGYRDSYPIVTDYTLGKSKKVAWFVSNCGSTNGRIEYATELNKYIEVDIYGSCGNLSCKMSSKKCFEMLSKDYYFYLSFENSNCRDYITEKYFLNGLSNNIVPIVMGAHPDDYERVSPPQSFIHVDRFDSPAQLAKYLHYLIANSSAYNKYLAWKGHGLVDTNTYFYCRLCAMLHDSEVTSPRHSSLNMSHWWSKTDNCVGSSWNTQGTTK